MRMIYLSSFMMGIYLYDVNTFLKITFDMNRLKIVQYLRLSPKIIIGI